MLGRNKNCLHRVPSDAQVIVIAVFERAVLQLTQHLTFWIWKSNPAAGTNERDQGRRSPKAGETILFSWATRKSKSGWETQFVFLPRRCTILKLELGTCPTWLKWNSFVLENFMFLIFSNPNEEKKKDFQLFIWEIWYLIYLHKNAFDLFATCKLWCSFCLNPLSFTKTFCFGTV